MAKFGIGQGVNRVEDQRFITGKGTYTDDINVSGQAFGTVVRSPVAHARIKSVDVEAAKSAPGVISVITAQEFASKAGNEIPCMVPIENRDGSQRANALRPILATEKVCHVGDHIAFVVAETASQARDAAELVEIDFEDLPAVYDTASATSSETLVHDRVAKNLALDWQHGDETAVNDAFSAAAKTVKIELVNNRVI
ncbi:MAG: xanthine dehydrogenase family protein molybdopterin-binding subunit, partial [Pseudomonadota bacterium]